MKNKLTEVLIHEGACIHYQWTPGSPQTDTDPEALPQVTITSVSHGDRELLNVLENIGTIGERTIEMFIDAVYADNVGRE